MLQMVVLQRGPEELATAGAALVVVRALAPMRQPQVRRRRLPLGEPVGDPRLSLYTHLSPQIQLLHLLASDPDALATRAAALEVVGAPSTPPVAPVGPARLLMQAWTSRRNCRRW